MEDEAEPISSGTREDILMEEEDALEEAKRAAESRSEGGSSETYCILTWISEHRGLLLAIAILIFIIRWKFKEWRHRWFAAFMEYMNREVNVKREELKKDLFTSLSTIQSHDPNLRKENAIKILEIGVGTGTNFAHYPEGTRLTVIDPNPHFKSYYETNRKKFPNIQAEDIIVSTGEDMDMIPDNSMDVVVVTLVFCSVDNTDKILKQILRILTPGGRFYFYEHIQEFDAEKHPTRKLMQTLLTKSGIWPLVLDKCCLDRNMKPNLEKAGFSEVEARCIYLPIDHFVFQLIEPSLVGYAVK